MASSPTGPPRDVCVEQLAATGDYKWPLTTALTDATVIASEHTCEDCGARGRIRFRGDGAFTWMRCLCDDCRTRPRTPAPSSGPRPASL